MLFQGNNGQLMNNNDRAGESSLCLRELFIFTKIRHFRSNLGRAAIKLLWESK